MPKGMFLPNGRKDRTAVGIDVRKTKTAKAMDLFFQIKPRAISKRCGRCERSPRASRSTPIKANDTGTSWRVGRT
jgi:hypothetical protein